MRSILFSAGMFVLGSMVGCADLLGIEPWEGKPITNSSDEDGGGGIGGAGGETGDSTSGSGSSDPGPCFNGIQDGTETGVDCGGGSCGRCEDGHGCVADTDCISTFCPSSRGYCISADGRAQCGIASVENPTCGDCIQNIDETDVDCGGVCAPCRAGKKCTNDGECWSDSCVSGFCALGSVNKRCFSNDDCGNGTTCAEGIPPGCSFETCCQGGSKVN